MKKRKYGISLIVLAVTILVMTILATTVIVSVNNSGIISKSKDTVKATNLKEVQDMASLAWTEVNIDIVNGKVDEDDLEKEVLKILKDKGIDLDEYYIHIDEEGVIVKANGWKQTGYTVTDGKVTLTVGDYVNYKANVSGYTDTNGWRVLGAENGEILLLSSIPVQKLQLGSTTSLAEAKQSYSTMFATIQNICDPYGEGDKASTVRSIKIEDINRITNYDMTTFTGAEYYESLGNDLDILSEDEKNELKLMDYDREITFYWDGTAYPMYSFKDNGNTITGKLESMHDAFVWYDEEDEVWRESTNPYISGSTTPIVDDYNSTKVAKITSNALYYSGEKLGTNTAAYEMLIADETAISNYWADDTGRLKYWLASPLTILTVPGPAAPLFGLRVVHGGKIKGNGFVVTNGMYEGGPLGVRVVVSLESEIELESAGTNSWTIAN